MFCATTVSLVFEFARRRFAVLPPDLRCAQAACP
jgi:hypothetical protein